MAAVEEVLPEGVLAAADLEDGAVRSTGADVHRGERADLALRVVRRHVDAEALGHDRDLAQLGDAADVDDVRHDHVDEPLGAQRREVVARGEALAGRERHAGLGADLANLLDHLVLELGHLLDPERPELLHPVAELDGRKRGRLAVRLDDDVEVRPHDVAHLGEMLHAAADRHAMVDRPAARVETALDAGPAVFLLLPPEVEGFLFVRGAALLAVADPFEVALVAVEPHLVAGLAAEELPDRLAEGLAEDVPHGDLDRGEGRHEHRAAAVTRADEHAAPVPLDLRRVLADEVALVVLDRGGNDFALVGEGAFAEAGYPNVGVELDEDEVLVVAGVDEEGAEVGYAEVEGLCVFEGLFQGAGLLWLPAQRSTSGKQAEGGEECVATVEGGHAVPGLAASRHRTWCRRGRRRTQWGMDSQTGCADVLVGCRRRRLETRAGP